MKANIDKYFISANVVDDIPESYYQKLEPVLQTIEAFTRNTNKVVYVVDYLKKNFLYSSDNIEELCGTNEQGTDSVHFSPVLYRKAFEQTHSI